MLKLCYFNINRFIDFYKLNGCSYAIAMKYDLLLASWLKVVLLGMTNSFYRAFDWLITSILQNFWPIFSGRGSMDFKRISLLKISQLLGVH